MKKIALLCFENPFSKPRDGAKNDMLTRILALQEYDCLIDLYIFDQYIDEPLSEETKHKYKINHYYQYLVEKKLSNLFSLVPISVLKRYSKKCIKDLAGNQYDITIYEGEHMSRYRKNDNVQSTVHILRQHDIESLYRFELAKSANSLLKKFAQWAEGHKYKLLERNINNSFDAFLFISTLEKEIFSTQFESTKNKFIHMPPAALTIEDNIMSHKKTTESNNIKTIVYFGNMELQNNILSIEWFADKVFRKILKEVPETKLRLIGKISELDEEKLISISDKIEVIGYAEDLKDEIQKATMVAAPVLYGAGVKVKVIDALSYGQIVCATTKTIEGTELIDKEHIIVDDNPNELAKRCIEVLKDRDEFEYLAINGLEFVKAFHSIDYQTQVLSQFISSNADDDN